MNLPTATPTTDSPHVQYVVLAAWHCHACDVQGRSPVEAAPTCWNCGGEEVIVTARPVLRLEEP